MQLQGEGIIEVLGGNQLAEEVITSGSDDFHFYTIRQPEVKAAMIGIGADLSPGLHHPKMTFNRDSLPHRCKSNCKNACNRFKKKL